MKRHRRRNQLHTDRHAGNGSLIRFRITYIANRGTARCRFNFALSQRQKEVATPWHQFENQGAEQAKHGSCSAWPEGLGPVSKDAQSFRNRGLLVQKPSGITIITTRLSAGAIHGVLCPTDVSLETRRNTSRHSTQRYPYREVDYVQGTLVEASHPLPEREPRQPGLASFYN